MNVDIAKQTTHGFQGHVTPGQTILFLFVAVYIAFQKHLLPHSAARLAAEIFFWPTMPITLLSRYNKLRSLIDETVILGVAPILPGYPKELYDMGVRGVVNLCDEYAGPKKAYKELGMKHHYIPTVDHTEPSVSDLRSAVEFIDTIRKANGKVYIHCKAGHGRSAAVVLAWLASQNPSAELKDLQMLISAARRVRKTLYLQPGVIKFHAGLGESTAKDTDNARKN